jgi:hypothetical protein
MNAAFLTLVALLAVAKAISATTEKETLHISELTSNTSFVPLSPRRVFAFAGYSGTRRATESSKPFYDDLSDCLLGRERYPLVAGIDLGHATTCTPLFTDVRYVTDPSVTLRRCREGYTAVFITTEGVVSNPVSPCVNHAGVTSPATHLHFQLVVKHTERATRTHITRVRITPAAPTEELLQLCRQREFTFTPFRLSYAVTLVTETDVPASPEEAPSAVLETATVLAAMAGVVFGWRYALRRSRRGTDSDEASMLIAIDAKARTRRVPPRPRAFLHVMTFGAMSLATVTATTTQEGVLISADNFGRAVVLLPLATAASAVAFVTGERLMRLVSTRRHHALAGLDACRGVAAGCGVYFVWFGIAWWRSSSAARLEALGACVASALLSLLSASVIAAKASDAQSRCGRVIQRLSQVLNLRTFGTSTARNSPMCSDALTKYADLRLIWFVVAMVINAWARAPPSLTEVAADEIGRQVLLATVLVVAFFTGDVLWFEYRNRSHWCWVACATATAGPSLSCARTVYGLAGNGLTLWPGAVVLALRTAVLWSLWSAATAVVVVVLTGAILAAIFYDVPDAVEVVVTAPWETEMS